MSLSPSSSQTYLAPSKADEDGPQKAINGPLLASGSLCLSALVMLALTSDQGARTGTGQVRVRVSIRPDTRLKQQEQPGSSWSTEYRSCWYPVSPVNPVSPVSPVPAAGRSTPSSQLRLCPSSLNCLVLSALTLLVKTTPYLSSSPFSSPLSSSYLFYPTSLLSILSFLSLVSYPFIPSSILPRPDPFEPAGRIRFRHLD